MSRFIIALKNLVCQPFGKGEAHVNPKMQPSQYLPTPPALPEAQAPTPLAEAVSLALTQQNDIDGLTFAADTLREVTGGTLEFSGCRFSHCTFADLHFKRISFVDCLFDHCDWSALHLANATFQRVKWVDSRLTGCEFQNAALMNVLLSGCTADYLALMDVKLTRVSLHQCRLRESLWRSEVYGIRMLPLRTAI
ncbi:MAG: pentapeptide repeat-containing protein [Candidatus Limiplasma sp.]|nr:pentapeptide repeat-containing protein [Candidatus Limiplasma sp.]MEA5144708.1 pentapeptide repeat-containing protein [Candidatus Limiplasma sp.]